MATNIEHRSHSGELRSGEGDGVIEGYAAVWGTVDSYGSSFQRGAFQKTLQERGKRVKVLWNHTEEVIGVPIEMREDDKGLFVRAQLVLATERARDTFELIKAGAIDTFSFGFRTIRDKWVDGVRQIAEAALYEFSPVIFEANSAAQITGVRTMPTSDDKAEKRAQQYAATYARYELNSRGYLIMEALSSTLSDIWWGDADQPSDRRSMIEAALGEFAGMYLTWTDDMLAKEQRSALAPLAQATREFLTSTKQTPEQLAATTSLTLDEVRALQAGRAEVARDKVPEALGAAFSEARAARLVLLCDELRAGITAPERDRLLGLLNPPPPQGEPAVDQALAVLQNFRKSLQGTQS